MQLITQIKATDGNIKNSNTVDFNFTPVTPTTSCRNFTDGTVLQCNIPNVFDLNPAQYIVKGNSDRNVRFLHFDSSTNAWVEGDSNWSMAIQNTEGIKVLITHPDTAGDFCDVYLALNDTEFNLIPGLVNKSSITIYVGSNVTTSTFMNYRRWEYSTTGGDGKVILAPIFIEPYSSTEDAVYFLAVSNPNPSSGLLSLKFTFWTQGSAVEKGTSSILVTTRVTLQGQNTPDSPTIDTRLTRLENQVSELTSRVDQGFELINARLDTINKSLSQVSGIFVSR